MTTMYVQPCTCTMWHMCHNKSQSVQLHMQGAAVQATSPRHWQQTSHLHTAAVAAAGGTAQMDVWLLRASLLYAQAHMQPSRVVSLARLLLPLLAWLCGPQLLPLQHALVPNFHLHGLVPGLIITHGHCQRLAAQHLHSHTHRHVCIRHKSSRKTTEHYKTMLTSSEFRQGWFWVLVHHAVGYEKDT